MYMNLLKNQILFSNELMVWRIRIFTKSGIFSKTKLMKCFISDIKLQEMVQNWLLFIVLSSKNLSFHEF